ncbi:MAG: hypothetical protein Q9187_001398 [Circinaria calcarea]
MADSYETELRTLFNVAPSAREGGRRLTRYSVDQELSAKFESELQLEKEMRDTDELPANVKDFLDNSPFELHDTPGQEEVVLTRTFGDEKIRITFNIADLNALDEDADRYSEDKALYDEDGSDMPTDTQSGGAQSKHTINQGRTKDGNFNIAPEDSIAPADRPELADSESPEEDQEPSFPARVNVTIEKPGTNGALQVETVAQDGVIIIENVYYYPTASLADPQSADGDWARRSMYTGPQFGNLDQDLQVLLERYLEERGINTALALWVPEYIDFKEQREYLDWLANIKSFVDA